MRELVARDRGTPQAVIADDDNESQWLKRDMRTVEICVFKGYFFARVIEFLL